MSLQLGITLTSGQKAYHANISNWKEMLERSKLDTLNNFKAAFSKAVVKALGTIEDSWLILVARDTGLLRAAFINAFESNFDLSLNKDTAQAEFLFNTSRFISDLTYSAYHLVQSSKFAFPAGYRFPTEPDTKPVNLAFFDVIAALLGNEIIHNMRLWGFDI